MTRSIFGWDLPPGVTHRMIEEQFMDHPCGICGELPDTCICPECPECGACGDPTCYDKGHPSDYPACEVQLQRNEAQILFKKLHDEYTAESIRLELEWEKHMEGL